MQHDLWPHFSDQEKGVPSLCKDKKRQNFDDQHRVCIYYANVFIMQEVTTARTLPIPPAHT